MAERHGYTLGCLIRFGAIGCQQLVRQGEAGSIALELAQRRRQMLGETAALLGAH